MDGAYDRKSRLKALATGRMQLSLTEVGHTGKGRSTANNTKIEVSIRDSHRVRSWIYESGFQGRSLGLQYKFKNHQHKDI